MQMILSPQQINGYRLSRPKADFEVTLGIHPTKAFFGVKGTNLAYDPIMRHLSDLDGEHLPEAQVPVP